MLTVNFKTDNSITKKVRKIKSVYVNCNAMHILIQGFRATWEEIRSTSTLLEGELKSPNFPNNYPSNKDQVYMQNSAN